MCYNNQEHLILKAPTKIYLVSRHSKHVTAIVVDVSMGNLGARFKPFMRGTLQNETVDTVELALTL